MGWSVYLNSSKEITESEVDKIVEELPKELSFQLGNSKQPWGWSTGADINKPEGKRLRIGGSYGISGGIAEEFVEYITGRLKSNGHEIKLQYNW